MKKFITILAIAFVSLNFVSCRQDDVTSEMEVSSPSQEKLGQKVNDTITSDSVQVNVAAQNAADPPKDPPKDRTHW